MPLKIIELEIRKGKYKFQNKIDALALCEKYGCPLYVYDCEVIKKQYNRLVNAFKFENLRVKYACKALTNINILKYIKSLGAGLDTVSIQEVKLGLLAGFDADQIIYTPNGVSMKEISLAAELGVRINIDNLSVLEEFGIQFPDYPVCIRINPHILAGGNLNISVGHIDSKFGISVHQLPLLLRIIKSLNIKVEGLHMHTGSDILDSEVFIQGAEILFKIAENFEDLDYIDLGSGFKISYKNDGVETDIEDLGEKLSKRFLKFTKEYGRDLKLFFEPGKYLVSKAGYFFCKVNVVKQTTSNVFIGVDSGFNHLIRPMLYNAHHDIVNVSKTEGKSRIYTVVGYICETDTFGINRKLYEVSEGDIVAFKNAGAYCFSMSSNYNSRYRPAEVMILDGKDYLIRRRETFDDLINTQIDISI